MGFRGGNVFAVKFQGKNSKRMERDGKIWLCEGRRVFTFVVDNEFFDQMMRIAEFPRVILFDWQKLFC